jgi:YVTN family beta-propeller protein
VGEDPVGAWQGSNGIAYVDNEKAKTLTTIDTQSLEIKVTYNLGFTPGMAALAPDGNLWVTDVDSGKLVIMNADRGMKVAEVPTAAGAHAIAFSGDAKIGYVSNQMAASVSVIDIATQKVTKTIPVGVKPDGMVWRAK